LEHRGADGSLLWSVAIDEIVLMAEYTTDDGPEADDYFLVFVTDEAGTQFYATATFYSEGREQVIARLAARWQTNIKLGLVSSTDWASRVIWPLQLAEQNYLELKEVQSKTLFEKLRKTTFGPIHEYSPSKAVLAFLAAQPEL
jgi:hypothetical protein